MQGGQIAYCFHSRKRTVQWQVRPRKNSDSSLKARLCYSWGMVVSSFPRTDQKQNWSGTRDPKLTGQAIEYNDGEACNIVRLDLGTISELILSLF